MKTSSIPVILAHLIGCGSEDGTAVVANPDAATSVPASPDAGQADVPPLQGGCDNDALPSANPCVLHESIGVFVSILGNDTNPGTRALPFRTIVKGIEGGKATNRRVYVCAAAYTEPTLTLQQDVAVHGNLTCAGGQWAVGTQHTAVFSTSTVAARATGIATDTRVEGVDLTAAPGVVPGESSIALIAENSPGLHFVSGALVAQDGADGADGVEGAQVPETPAGFGGEAVAPERACTVQAGPIVNVYACPGRSTAAGGGGTCSIAGIDVAANPGGAGGSSAPHRGLSITAPPNPPLFIVRRASSFTIPVYYFENNDGLPEVGTLATTAGSRATYGSAAGDTVPTANTPAVPGAAGTDGANGAGAAQIGALAASGYVPAGGAAGANGAPGQGGGGGAGATPTSIADGAYRTGSSGAGGGAGGCAGLAGTPGSGGGASIALLATRSPMRLETTLLRASRGGIGGRGALGSGPRAGGSGGAGGSGYGAGAAGGSGGAAGWSGHGGSGPSFAVAWSGAAVVPSADSKVEVAAPREGRPALSADGKTIPTALPGLAAAIYPID